MLEHYPLLKHLHITAAYASLAFFVLRAIWSIRGNSLLQTSWVKITPHLLDTLLLTLGVTMAALLSLWPLPGWLSAKLVGLIIYILLGTVAIKRGSTPRIRLIAAFLAVLIFIYILGSAHQHHPGSWFSLL
ncbi:Invasion gene expression up-regulator SirB [Nitrincola sp. A-D6]|uniref:SirB2 family protein n=1 Tax=Nitrincola sp. A-D6 TaxID=1545442 RepID=UPI00051FC116|nr:SirB2 family protein [Nitrincola sp. A-D6]KGK42136.1 Invasion gene expression up-regulator SirB [Nitrincola sp. A-D6]